MQVLQCDICDTILKPEENKHFNSITVEGREYKDLCYQCNNRLVKKVKEWVELSHCKAICPECGK